MSVAYLTYILGSKNFKLKDSFIKDYSISFLF